MHLLHMFKPYFDRRKVTIDSQEGAMEVNVTGGVLQGSVVGPLLWDLTYNAVSNSVTINWVGAYWIC